MQLENQFELPLPPATAWPILMNVAQTAACFPGAGSIEQISADRYKGLVTVKLGPLVMIFTGNLRIEDRNDVAYSATVRAHWTESKGRGNAVTVTRFALMEQDNSTCVAIKSDLQLAGQVAQYGRGVGMIAEISAQLVSTFAVNLRRRIQAADADGTVPAESHAAPEISGLTLMAKALGSRLKR